MGHHRGRDQRAVEDSSLLVGLVESLHIADELGPHARVLLFAADLGVDVVVGSVPDHTDGVEQVLDVAHVDEARTAGCRRRDAGAVEGDGPAGGRADRARRGDIAVLDQDPLAVCVEGIERIARRVRILLPLRKELLRHVVARAGAAVVEDVEPAEPVVVVADLPALGAVVVIQLAVVGAVEALVIGVDLRVAHRRRVPEPAHVLAHDVVAARGGGGPLTVDQLPGLALEDHVQHVRLGPLGHADVLVPPVGHVDGVDLGAVARPLGCPGGDRGVAVQGLVLLGTVVADGVPRVGAGIVAEVVEGLVAQVRQHDVALRTVELVEGLVPVGAVVRAGRLGDEDLRIDAPVDDRDGQPRVRVVDAVVVVDALDQDLAEACPVRGAGVVVAVLGQGHVHRVVETPHPHLFRAHLLGHDRAHPADFRHLDDAHRFLVEPGHYLDRPGHRADDRRGHRPRAVRQGGAGLQVHVSASGQPHLAAGVEQARVLDQDVARRQLAARDAARGELGVAPARVDAGVDLDVGQGPHLAGDGQHSLHVEQDPRRRVVVLHPTVDAQHPGHDVDQGRGVDQGRAEAVGDQDVAAAHDDAPAGLPGLEGRARQQVHAQAEDDDLVVGVDVGHDRHVALGGLEGDAVHVGADLTLVAAQLAHGAEDDDVVRRPQLEGAAAARAIHHAAGESHRLSALHELGRIGGHRAVGVEVLAGGVDEGAVLVGEVAVLVDQVAVVIGQQDQGLHDDAGAAGVGAADDDHLVVGPHETVDQDQARRRDAHVGAVVQPLHEAKDADAGGGCDADLARRRHAQGAAAGGVAAQEAVLGQGQAGGSCGVRQVDRQQSRGPR